jgi:hypothetical protein
MKKRAKKNKGIMLKFPDISLIIVSALMAAYLILGVFPFQQTQPSGQLAPPVEGTVDINLLNPYFMNNAIVINISAPDIIATGTIQLKLPAEFTIDTTKITGTGAFETANIRAIKGNLVIQYFDLTPSDYEGSIVIPFSATQPGDYTVDISAKTGFVTKKGKALLLPTPFSKTFTLQMYNFSFYVVPSLAAPQTVNTIPAGSFGDIVVNTTIPGDFTFNLKTTDNLGALIESNITASTQQPVYILTEAFDSYLHPESTDCNAGTAKLTLTLNYRNSKITNSVDVNLVKPKLDDIYRIVDRYFDTSDMTLVPRAYYMVDSFFACP